MYNFPSSHRPTAVVIKSYRTSSLVHKNHTRYYTNVSVMYHAACKVEFQSFKWSYSQLATAGVFNLFFFVFFFFNNFFPHARPLALSARKRPRDESVPNSLHETLFLEHVRVCSFLAPNSAVNNIPPCNNRIHRIHRGIALRLLL